MSVTGPGELAEVLLRSSTPGASDLPAPVIQYLSRSLLQLPMRKVIISSIIRQVYSYPMSVLKYLETIPRDTGAMSPHSAPPSEVGSQRSSARPAKKPSDWDPISPKVTGAPNLYAPSPKSGSLNQGLDDLAGSPVSYSGVNGARQERDDDLDSNVQQGMRSELGETIPIHTTGMVGLQVLASWAEC